MSAAMSIHQAARWASRQGARDLYIAYDDSHTVACIGSYDKCAAFIESKCMPGPMHTGAYREIREPYMRAGYPWKCSTLRLYSIETLQDEVAEAEAEAHCIPDTADLREFA